MTVRTAVAAAALLAVSVSACATTVSGSGHRAGPQAGPTEPTIGIPTAPPTPLPSGSPTAPAPTTPGQPAVPDGRFSCPRISYPHAKLSFNCIVDGLTLSTNNPVWPISLRKTVETQTGWVLEEGAGNWGDAGSDSQSAIAKRVRAQMIDAGQYGESPKTKTERDADTRIGKVKAHVLQTTITLDPTWAKARGTKVTTEKLWIVVLPVSAHDTALWYVSVPNLASRLWARVPATLRSIRAG